MDDVVVIGGGIIGAATAYFLSKEGRKVKVIERDPTYKLYFYPYSLSAKITILQLSSSNTKLSTQVQKPNLED